MHDPAVKKFFKTVDIENIWIFITDRCNLDCDYCFFNDRTQSHDLGFGSILELLKFLPVNKNHCFVVSGGEPLLCWDLTKKTIVHLGEVYPKSTVSLQTNMLFLSAGKAKILKKENVIVESGLDGSFLVNLRHRRGFDRRNFLRCLKNIRMIVECGLQTNPTMTVHPQEVGLMFENFQYLVSLGLNQIEIHPAFMADWSRQNGKVFLKEYKKILDYDRSRGSRLVSREYSKTIKQSLDLVIQPDGNILPNWTFLAFPYDLRKDFFIFHLSERGIRVFEKNLIGYLKKTREFFKAGRSYRDFSNFNASLALAKGCNREMDRRFKVYRDICTKVQKIDRFLSGS